MAFAILAARPNSHPFSERKVMLNEQVKIGRAVAKCKPAANNLIFDCKVLSRSHAVMWYLDGKFYIQDTKSSNGTYVNNAQVGRGSEDSDGREIKSGDILQFGVDVTENSKKVTHGCIIATVTLILADGTEALGEPVNQSNRTLPFLELDKGVKSQELWQLSRYLQDALNREQMLEQKLATMQRMISNASDASEGAFQAFVKEDELLSRLDILENELDIMTKDNTEEQCNKVLIEFQEEKECYEKKTKETIERLLQEKVDALQKLADVQKSLGYSEDECSQIKCLFDKSEEDIKDLMESHEQRSNEVKHLQEQLEIASRKQKEKDAQADEEQRNLKILLEEAEKRSSTLAVQTESLQAECDFTKKQLTAIKEKLDQSQLTTSEKPDDTSAAEYHNTTILTEDKLKHIENLEDSLHQIRKAALTIAATLNAPGCLRNLMLDNEYIEEENNDSMQSAKSYQIDDCDKRLESCIKQAAKIQDCFEQLSDSCSTFKSLEDFPSLMTNTEDLEDTQSEVCRLRQEVSELNDRVSNEQIACEKYKELAASFEEQFKELETRVETQFQDKLKKPDDLASLDDETSQTLDTIEGENLVNEPLIKEITVLHEESGITNLDQSDDDHDNKEIYLSNHSENEQELSNRSDPVHNNAKDISTENSQGVRMFQVIIALIVLFVAIGAAILLDVINVSFGTSPIFDPKLWTEIKEYLF